MRLTVASATLKNFAATGTRRILKRAAVFFEPFGDLVFIDFLVGDRHDKVKFLVHCGTHIMAVEPQRQTHRFKSDPFISIDKRVVEDKGVPQDGGLDKNIRVQVLPAEGRLGPVNSGLQKMLAAQPLGTAAYSHDPLVQIDDLIWIKIVHALANRLSNSSSSSRR